jgi:hypothetical protein
MAKQFSRDRFEQLTSGKKFHRVMKEFGKGKLRDSNGNVVTKHSQAVAIASSEQARVDKEGS